HQPGQAVGAGQQDDFFFGQLPCREDEDDALYLQQQAQRITHREVAVPHPEDRNVAGKQAALKRGSRGFAVGRVAHRHGHLVFVAVG
ncbi:hypothetical protein B1218_35985, partial [Pseudomonas ogarae]